MVHGSLPKGAKDRIQDAWTGAFLYCNNLAHDEIGNVVTKQGKDEKAMEQYQRAHAISIKTLGPDHTKLQ